MIYLVYERATGLVVGSIEANRKPIVLAHHDTVETASMVDISAARVVNGVVRVRAPLNFDAPAAGAMISVNDGPAIPAAGYSVPAQLGTYRIVALGDFIGERTVVVRTLADEQAYLIEQVKNEGERRRMLVMSPGGSKKTVYSLKQSEVDTWNDLGSTLATQLTAALGLSPVKQKRKFRFAMAEAALRGEPNAAAAIARFAKGSDDANAEAARIEAIEQTAVVAIKAATTIATKRAAFNAINWNWTA